MTEKRWPVGSLVRPVRDTCLCQFADVLRTMKGPEAPESLREHSRLARAGRSVEALSDRTLASFGSGAAERVEYTLQAYYDDDMIIVVQSTRAVGGNYRTCGVGFASSRDFRLVES